MVSETLITGDRRGGEKAPPCLCGRTGFSRQAAENTGRSLGYIRVSQLCHELTRKLAQPKQPLWPQFPVLANAISRSVRPGSYDKQDPFRGK